MVANPSSRCPHTNSRGLLLHQVLLHFNYPRHSTADPRSSHGYRLGGKLSAPTCSNLFPSLTDLFQQDLVVLSTLTSVPLPMGGANDACSNNCAITAPLYDPSTSSSAEVTSNPVSITYGTGSAEGVLISDRMGFGGWTANQVRQGSLGGGCRRWLTFPLSFTNLPFAPFSISLAKYHRASSPRRYHSPPTSSRLPTKPACSG